jgi:hypothetical protein
LAGIVKIKVGVDNFYIRNLINLNDGERLIFETLFVYAQGNRLAF